MCKFNTLFPSQSSFIVEKTIASGSTTILLIKCLTDSNHYALKLFHRYNPNSLYSKEKQIHASLDHPNIIKCIQNSQLNIPEQIAHFNILTLEYAPYGDFFNLMIDHPLPDEKLIRTYFHQFIQGLKYLHSQGIAHLDIKLENLFLGEDFILKIADFDLSQDINKAGNNPVLSRGTANYRAPEVLTGDYKNHFAADIYSAGVCLYTLMAGAFPFMEEKVEEKNEVELFRYDTYLEDNERFWEENQEIVGAKLQFSQSFVELVNKMWAKDPLKRATLGEIEQSNWYNGPVYSQEKMRVEMEKLLRQ